MVLITEYVKISAVGSAIDFLKKNNLLEIVKVNCPKCGSSDFTGNGKPGGFQRGRCLSCKNLYMVERVKTPVNVPVSLLLPSCKQKVTRRCDTCGREDSVLWASYYKAKENRDKTGLDNCKSCANKLAQLVPNKPKRPYRIYEIAHRKWAKNIKERDGFTCQACGQVGGKLVSHHIIPWQISEEHRMIMDNGITLCDRCHNDYHNMTGGKKTLTRCNRDTLDEFISGRKALTANGWNTSGLNTAR